MLGMPQLGEPLRFVLRLRHDCAGFHCDLNASYLRTSGELVRRSRAAPTVELLTPIWRAISLSLSDGFAT